MKHISSRTESVPLRREERHLARESHFVSGFCYEANFRPVKEKGHVAAHVTGDELSAQVSPRRILPLEVSRWCTGALM